jgi:hypothetical protein
MRSEDGASMAYGDPARQRLHNDQVLLIDDGPLGTRLGDGWLLPVPLRPIARAGDRVTITSWSPCLPQLLARPAGRA